MQDFRKLLVWQKAYRLAVKIHGMTSAFPRQGNSGLVSQIRRAAESVPANIAEGSRRGSDSDFANFIQIAIASNSELELHLQYVTDIGLLPRELFKARMEEIIEVRKMLIGLRKRLRSADSAGAPS